MNDKKTICETIEITPEMIEAGAQVLIIEYNFGFNRLEDDLTHFLSRIFSAMAAAQNANPTQPTTLQQTPLAPRPAPK